MEKFKQGPISKTDLMARLAAAGKVMKKVETGNYERGLIDESRLIENNDLNEYVPETPVQQNQLSTTDRIQQSKLPPSIKEAMINRPIAVPSLSLEQTFDPKFVDGVKRIMSDDIPKTKQTKKPIYESKSFDINDDRLMTLIENTIRRVLDEKLNQILMADKMGTINENLVIKVGKSTFTGKLTEVKKSN